MVFHRLGFLTVALLATSLLAQQPAPTKAQRSQAATEEGERQQSPPTPIPANAPKMSKQTRYQIIRDFETQVVYSKTVFPMGTKGLKLEDGKTTPGGSELQQMIAIYGPAIKPGDPAQISFVQIKDNYIHFDLNGGAIRRKKWYQHIEIAGANGEGITPGGNQTIQNPHGSYLEIYFNKYVPEMTPQQLRNLLYPVLDFNARSKEQAYLDTVPPNVKKAILEHRVLVGMDPEMVLYAMGRPPKKDRERDGDTEYEEWIYGEPPQDVNFVRFEGGEVVRLEIMKVGGEKIVRTQKEVFLEKPEKEAKAEQEERPANAPSLRRPGEDSQDVPKPHEGGIVPTPMPPPDLPQPGGPPGGGPPN